MKKTSSRSGARPVTTKTAGELNAAQQRAVQHGRSPLLIIAGAGTGKTLTLAHRAAHLIEEGVPPERILLLTFTRRAAEAMLQRVEAIRTPSPVKPTRKNKTATPPVAIRKVWGGTFHAVGARLLRIHGPAIGVDPGFTIHDTTDAEDLLDLLRDELQLAEKHKDFPKKSVCQPMHSGWINSGRELEAFLDAYHPGSRKHLKGLQQLFQVYAERKRQQNIFDFDDLLLYWNKLLADPVGGELVRRRVRLRPGR